MCPSECGNQVYLRPMFASMTVSGCAFEGMNKFEDVSVSEGSVHAS